MLGSITRESNITSDAFVIMFITGVVAKVGISWVMEIASVAIFSAITFYWKKVASYKRQMAG